MNDQQQLQQQQMAMGSASGEGLMHQTISLHSQSQKNALGIGNHPDSALEQNNNNNAYVSYLPNEERTPSVHPNINNQ